MQLTEGRVPVFSHDIVPNYLRTKPDPTAESRMIAHEQKANSLNAEAASKQVIQFNKVVAHVSDIISEQREKRESESSTRAGRFSYYSI